MDFFALTDTASLMMAASIFGKITSGLMIVLGLGLVIFFHELGHFMVAKWCNVHVERFSIGMGPILWSRQWGETEYALSALPIGGYVKMLGQDDMDPNQMTSDEIAEDPRAYSSKSVLQRMAIISAGVIMNIVTGTLFFIVAYSIGVQEPPAVIGQVTPGGRAWQAGLRPGDIVTKIDGYEVRGFDDIVAEVTLSSHPLSFEGIHADGEAWKTLISPVMEDSIRQIGAGNAQGLKLPDVKDIVLTTAGLPARRAEIPFEPGDTVLGVNSKPLKFMHELADVTAHNAANPMTYNVLRKAPPGEDRDSGAEVDITVEPQPVRQLGIWMTMGAIDSIIQGSVAEKAKLQPGDLILEIDGKIIGKELDPLRIPFLAADKGAAGEAMELKLIRKRKGGLGEEELTVSIVPTDRPDDLNVTRDLSKPVAADALGIAYTIIPRVAHVVPDSAASKWDIAENALITRIELSLPPGPSTSEKEKEAPLVIDFEGSGDAGSRVENPNWAVAFWRIQEAPEETVKISWKDNESSEVRTAELDTKVPEVDWYLPYRGVGTFLPHTVEVKSKSVADGFALSIRKTRLTTIRIYMSLRSLIRGDVGAKNLRGPLGIVSIGYQVAERGFPELLIFLAFLSINLAVLNFLPIPILDGGHMVFLIWEGVTRRKPSPRVVSIAHLIGVVFILSLFVFVLYLDIFVHWLGIGES